MQCPKCGGEMWNNIGRKKNPKQPDYKCKDKECDGVIWPEREQQGQPQGGKPAPAKNGAKWTWPALNRTYGRSLLLAEQQLVGSAARTKLVFTPADLLAAAATIFIAASRDGVSDAPKAQPAPLPPPPPAPVAADEEDDDDLPF
jgi:hypothetical protein